MAKVNWTKRALKDLTSIADFIARDSVKYARLTIEHVKEKAEQLAQFPAIGRIVPETEVVNVREIISGNYRIIYKVISNDQVDIITVHHSSMELNIKA